MLESKFKKRTERRIRKRLQRVKIYIVKSSTEVRSAPDLFILGSGMWAALEFKKHKDADRQPNQEHIIDYLDNMSYATFVYPENVEGVLDDLEELFTS